MGRKLNKPAMVYVDGSGNKRIYFPVDAYTKAEKVRVLETLAEMAKIVDSQRIKRFEDWKKDPGFDV
jgi:hypothetical protein